MLRLPQLREKIPKNESDWKNVRIGAEIPDSKILMESGKLQEATTQRDSDNFLMDNIRRQVEKAEYESENYKNSEETQKRYRQLGEAARNTFKNLKKYEEKVLALNRERKNNKNISFEWMVPSKIQTRDRKSVV